MFCREELQTPCSLEAFCNYIKMTFEEAGKPFIYFVFACLFIFERERERERERAGEEQRERGWDGESQAGTTPTEESPMRGSNAQTMRS